MDRTSAAGYLKRNGKNTEAQSTEELGSFKIIQTGEPISDASTNGTSSEYKIVCNETRQTNRHKYPSGVWKFFALATRSTAEDPDSPQDDRLLCMLCYSKGRVHVYKSKTSSSNLWKHLNRKHDIEIPTEKMFTISSANFDGLDFTAFQDEHSHEANSIDDQLSGLDAEVEIKSDVFEETNGFAIDEERKNAETIVKYETCTTEAVFKDIGMAIIEEISKRPVLYELHSNKSASVRLKKEQMWTEVYEALGEIIQIDRIQKIWKNIRDRYRKIRNAEKAGLEETPHKYKYYNQLQFLDAAATTDQSSDTSAEEPPMKKPRGEDYSFLIEQADVMLSAVDELDRCEQNFIAEEMDARNCAVSSSNPPFTAQIYPTSISSDDSPPKQLPSSPTANNPEQMDEFDLFGRLIAKKLRSAPKDRVNFIEIKIMQAILENS